MHALPGFPLFNQIKPIVIDWVSAVWAALGWKPRRYNKDVEPRHKCVTCQTEGEAHMTCGMVTGKVSKDST